MKNEYVGIIKDDPNYKKLISRRSSFSIKLTVAMLIVYFSFILSIAFEPSLLGIPISSGSVITVGIPVGIFVIIFAFVLTGIYTYKANSEFDDLSKKISKNLKEKLDA